MRLRGLWLRVKSFEVVPPPVQTLELYVISFLSAERISSHLEVFLLLSPTTTAEFQDEEFVTCNCFFMVLAGPCASPANRRGDSKSSLV
jgi:hypothetical protein